MKNHEHTACRKRLTSPTKKNLRGTKYRQVATHSWMHRMHPGNGILCLQLVAQPAITICLTSSIYLNLQSLSSHRKVHVKRPSEASINARWMRNALCLSALNHLRWSINLRTLALYILSMPNPLQSHITMKLQDMKIYNIYYISLYMYVCIKFRLFIYTHMILYDLTGSGHTFYRTPRWKYELHLCSRILLAVLWNSTQTQQSHTLENNTDMIKHA